MSLIKQYLHDKMMNNDDWMTEPQIEELVNFQYADDEQALKELMEEEEFKFDSYLNSDIDY